MNLWGRASEMGYFNSSECRPSPAFAVQGLVSELHSDLDPGADAKRVGAIQFADRTSHFDAASVLVNKMYSWRGYGDDHEVMQDPSRITLMAAEGAAVVGTMSVGIDAADTSLTADQLFKEELDAHRAAGARLCELTKLAVEPSARSKFTLASLFHFALVYARDVHACTDAIMEVNPRHRGFYQRMLGFRQTCEARTNLSVNAPACLMHIRIEHVSMQVLQHGGTAARTSSTVSRSFYEFFHSPEDETDILDCLRTESAFGCAGA